MSKDLMTYVETLAKKAADQAMDSANYAQQFAQAALNVANAARVVWDMEQPLPERNGRPRPGPLDVED